jgi:hypothetical protein
MNLKEKKFVNLLLMFMDVQIMNCWENLATFAFQSFLRFFPGRRVSSSRVFPNYTLRRFCIHILHLHVRRIKKIKPGNYEFFYKNNVKTYNDVRGAQGRQGSSLWASL